MDEALSVLSGKSDGLGEAVANKLKGIMSARPDTFSDRSARHFITDDRVIEIVKSGTRKILVGKSIESEQRQARKIYEEMFDQEEAYGERIIEDAIQFTLLTVLGYLTPPDRLLVELIATGQENLRLELEELRSAVVGPATERPNQDCREPLVSVGRLPASSTSLVGRSMQLKQLRAAWEGGAFAIVSLVGWGGVGKSALIHRFLSEQAAAGWNGADHVFDWSFSGQGQVTNYPTGDFFILEALQFLGDPNPAEGGPSERGKRLATFAASCRCLFVLDGLEVLQTPSESGPPTISDPGMRSFLLALAWGQPGLCIVSSRYDVTELSRHIGTTVKRLELNGIQSRDGARLLKQLGVRGSPGQLAKVARSVDGHPLSLSLLGRYIVRVFPDRAFYHWPEFDLLGAEAGPGQKAIVILDWYREWLGSNSFCIKVLWILSLFDRPSSESLFREVARRALPNLNVSIDNQGEDQLGRAFDQLIDLRLIEVSQIDLQKEISLHPLVQEYFIADFQDQNESSFRKINEQIGEYFCSIAPEPAKTANDLTPVYAAFRHLCLAGKTEQAFTEIYQRKILRYDLYFSWKTLGLFAANLSSLRYAFESPWTVPSPSLPAGLRAEALSEAGIALRGVGRLREARVAWETSLPLWQSEGMWEDASVVAGNLCEMAVSMGELEDAKGLGRLGLAFAERVGDGRKCINSAKLGHAQFLGGDYAEAKHQFRETVRLQNLANPNVPSVTSVQGYYINNAALERCTVPIVSSFLYDTLLGQRRRSSIATALRQVLEQSAASYMRVESLGWILSMALDRLAMARAHTLLAALYRDPSRYSLADQMLEEAFNHFEAARQEQELPRYYLAHALSQLFRNEFTLAEESLRRSEEISCRTGMVQFALDAMTIRLIAGASDEATNKGVLREAWIRTRQQAYSSGYLHLLKLLNLIERHVLNTGAIATDLPHLGYPNEIKVR